MSRGKRPKRGGGSGSGGLRRPPPVPPREPPAESEGGGNGIGPSARRAASAAAASSAAAAFPRKEDGRRRRDDPPDDDPPPPPPTSSFSTTRSPGPPPPPARVGDGGVGGRGRRRANNDAPGDDDGRGRSSFPPIGTRSPRDGGDRRRGGRPYDVGEGDEDSSLDMDEEERYEEYQEQLYRRRNDYNDDDDEDDARRRQQRERPRSRQSTAQRQLQRPKQQSPPRPISSSHRQFDLTPLCDVEMTSLGGRREQKQKMKTTSTRKDGANINETPSYTGRYTQGRHTGETRPSREQINPLVYNGKVIAYLDDADGDDGDGDNSDDSLEEGGYRRHEEFYNHAHVEDDDDNDDDDDYDYDDDDEGRPLMTMPPRSSILTRSEKCLNRTIVLAFATLCFLFVRDRTPWWKEHVRHAKSLRHHHHHVLAGTDDDDLEGGGVLDPMTVYNTNDDDSTHTRDHDPLHQFDHITKKDIGLDDGEDRARDDDREYDAATAGERISNRPGSKSLHHGFMDEAYEDRPVAKNSMSKEAVTAGALGSHGGADAGGTVDGFGAKASLVIPPPPPSNRSSIVDGKPGGIKEAGGGIMGGSIMNGGSPARPPEPAPDSNDAQGPEQRMVGTPANTGHQNLEDMDSRDTLVEWGAPDDNVDSSTKQIYGGTRSVNESAHGESLDDTHYVADANEFGPSGEKTMAKSPSSPSETSTASALDQPIFDQSLMSGEDVKSAYEDSFFRWNHPLRPIVPSDDGKDVPVFWRVPRSASSTVESVMSFCYRMVLANSMGIAAGHDQDETLDIITVGTGARYVNVDMASPAGILRAKTMNLGSSGLVDVISTPFLFETVNIFKGTREAGKCFTMLRHPVDRAISMYHHFKITESGNPSAAQYGGMTIDEFADSFAENNWMVRFLANKRSGSLTWRDLEAAKEVFGRKCLVGLVDKAEESMRRYERFFGWDTKIPNSAAKDKCVQQYLENGDKRKVHPNYEGTAAWETLRKKNEYDEILYEYAKNLYDQQSTIYEKISK